MSRKRPSVDLMALTSDQAMPMPEASQRTALTSTVVNQQTLQTETTTRPSTERIKTENLEALAFKVSPAFRRRFRQHAAASDLKLNELLFAALDAWEEKNGIKY